MPGRDVSEIRADFLTEVHYIARARDLEAFFRIPFVRAKNMLALAEGRLDKVWANVGVLNPINLTRYYASKQFFLTRLLDDQRRAPWRDTMLKFLDGIPAGASVLDHGAGTGQYSMWLAYKGCKVTATEIAGWMTKWMRWWFARYRVDITVKNIGNVADIDVLEDETFDVVLLIAVLEHVPDPLGMAKMMMRRVKTGGKLFAVLGAFKARGHLPESLKLMQEVKILLESSKSIEATVCMVTR